MLDLSKGFDVLNRDFLFKLSKCGNLDSALLVVNPGFKLLLLHAEHTRSMTSHARSVTSHAPSMHDITDAVHTWIT